MSAIVTVKALRDYLGVRTYEFRETCEKLGVVLRHRKGNKSQYRALSDADVKKILLHYRINRHVRIRSRSSPS